MWLEAGKDFNLCVKKNMICLDCTEAQRDKCEKKENDMVRGIIKKKR